MLGADLLQIGFGDVSELTDIKSSLHYFSNIKVISNF